MYLLHPFCFFVHYTALLWYTCSDSCNSCVEVKAVRSCGFQQCYHVCIHHCMAFINASKHWKYDTSYDMILNTGLIMLLSCTYQLYHLLNCCLMLLLDVADPQVINSLKYKCDSRWLSCIHSFFNQCIAPITSNCFNWAVVLSFSLKSQLNYSTTVKCISLPLQNCFL